MPETRVDTIRPWSAGVPVPAAVAVCAACGTTLTVERMALEEDVAGAWRASEIVWDCDAEPDREDAAAWQTWLASHQEPSVQARLALEARLLDWLTAHVRFKEACGDADV